MRSTWDWTHRCRILYSVLRFVSTVDLHVSLYDIWFRLTTLDRDRNWFYYKKQSLYGPEMALTVPGGWDAQIKKKSALEGGKVVRLSFRQHLSPRNYSWYSFVLVAESTPEPWCSRKDYVNGKFQWHHRKSNPPTFRLVAQCLKQLRHQQRAPGGLLYFIKNSHTCLFEIIFQFLSKIRYFYDTGIFCANSCLFSPCILYCVLYFMYCSALNSAT